MNFFQKTALAALLATIFLIYVGLLSEPQVLAWVVLTGQSAGEN